MSEGFYRAFEERFRGPRETIRARLAAYLPFVLPLAAARPGCRALDLGCGRGEWLELMREHGIDAHGVDLDEGMLADCRAAGLSAARGDAIATLRQLPAESHDIVSAFHLVEHLPFEALHDLAREALRVLKPGGLLILETPDPENPTVTAASFYLDPTHLRPLPAGLLAFLPEYHGFDRVKVVRLQESAGARHDAPRLVNVLRDASADYAVVARKKAPPADAAGIDAAFDKEYGVTAEALAVRYDAAIEARLRGAEERAESAATLARDLLQSKSWGLTAPLRWIGGALRRISGKSDK